MAGENSEWTGQLPKSQDGPKSPSYNSVFIDLSVGLLGNWYHLPPCQRKVGWSALCLKPVPIYFSILREYCNAVFVVTTTSIDFPLASGWDNDCIFGCYYYLIIWWVRVERESHSNNCCNIFIVLHFLFQNSLSDLLVFQKPCLSTWLLMFTARLLLAITWVQFCHHWWERCSKKAVSGRWVKDFLSTNSRCNEPELKPLQLHVEDHREVELCEIIQMQKWTTPIINVCDLCVCICMCVFVLTLNCVPSLSVYVCLSVSPPLYTHHLIVADYAA